MKSVMIGWGHTRFGKLDLSLEGMIVAAAAEALHDAGIGGDFVDGVFLGQYNNGLVGDGFCSSMVLAADPALRFKPATRLENACASGSAAMSAAMDAIASGRMDCALVVGAEKMTGVDGDAVTRALGSAAYQAEEAGLSFPAIFARFAKAYGAKYQDPTEAMAVIAHKNHGESVNNPLAQLQKALELDFCRHVSDKNPSLSIRSKKLTVLWYRTARQRWFWCALIGPGNSNAPLGFAPLPM